MSISLEGDNILCIRHQNLIMYLQLFMSVDWKILPHTNFWLPKYQTLFLFHYSHSSYARHHRTYAYYITASTLGQIIRSGPEKDISGSHFYRSDCEPYIYIYLLTPTQCINSSTFLSQTPKIPAALSSPPDIRESMMDRSLSRKRQQS